MAQPDNVRLFFLNFKAYSKMRSVMSFNRLANTNRRDESYRPAHRLLDTVAGNVAITFAGYVLDSEL